MLPLYPPYAINDLAHEHLEGRLPDGRPRHRHRHDPDRFLDESSALQPDPVFMGLRNAVSASPIGHLMRWIDRNIETREDRVAGSRTDEGAVPITLAELESPRLHREDDRKSAA